MLNDSLIGPHDFHGAKFYSDLAGERRLERLSRRGQRVLRRRADPRSGPRGPRSPPVDRQPTWEGWAAVERISERYGIGEVNLVKPGVGETTRVLLRRVPERVLVRPSAWAELPHVLHLARQRGVPVEAVADLSYSCVGLIEPRSGGEG